MRILPVGFVALPIAFGALACGVATEAPSPGSELASQAQSSSYCARVGAAARAGYVGEIDCGITRGPKVDKKIALVFTAGYFCEGGPTFLDALKREGGLASFFLLSPAATSNEREAKCDEVLPRLIREGHYVGPHSHTHPDLVDGQGGATTITRANFKQEIALNVATLRSKGVTGNMNYWIPPSETYNKEIAGWSAEEGLRTVHMSDCPKTRGDYLSPTAYGGRYSNTSIVKSVFDCERQGPSGLNGAILFFHLGVGNDRAEHAKFHHAFPEMLSRLRGLGYSFVRIDELLNPVL